MTYSPEFRHEVAQVAADIGALAAARRYGVAFRSVYGWLRKARLQPARNADTQVNPERVGVHDDGTLDVTCWCERRVVRVPAPVLRNGITRSCDHPACQQGRAA